MSTTRKVFLLISQLLVLFFCIWYIRQIYYKNILPDKSVKEEYSQTQCNVLSKGLSTKGKLIRSYRADILVNYIVNNFQYNQWASGNGLDRSYSTSRSSQEDVLNEFSIGGNYPCWYNPKTPHIVVLVLRHNWTSTFPLLLPSAIALLMIFYMFRTGFELVGEKAIQTREKIRQKRAKKSPVKKSKN